MIWSYACEFHAQAVDAWGTVDVLINNAGAMRTLIPSSLIFIFFGISSETFINNVKL